MKFDLDGVSDGVAQVRLAGRISQESISPFGDVFRDQLGADAYEQHVLVDMSGVEWLDSSGVSWLLSARRNFREHGGNIVLHSLPPLVHDVLRVLNLHKTFTIAHSADEGLGSLKGRKSP